MARSRSKSAKTSTLRVIGGQWRGRKLRFTPAPGLRPTTDRIRETVFNWLAPVIAGARCLDLFAGSGALGIEALSRGAAHCDFVDTSADALGQISRHLDMLGASTRGECHRRAAAAYLAAAAGGYDVVFIDPPFGLGLVAETSIQLAQGALLSPEAVVYIEMAAAEGTPQVPEHWQAYREKRAGEVAYRLFLAGREAAKNPG
jgi:16S rRNA (guanine966-N2)-methyltransferase